VPEGQDVRDGQHVWHGQLLLLQQLHHGGAAGHVGHDHGRQAAAQQRGSDARQRLVVDRGQLREDANHALVA
jgi:hypothetical protein